MGSEEDPGSADKIVRLEQPALEGQPALADVRSAVALARQWAEAPESGLGINVQAVRAALDLIAHWLDETADLETKITNVDEDMLALARAHLSFDWLFDEDDQPIQGSITPDMFEKLVELRVAADRLLRALGR